jgi:hypothetical protein
MTGGCGGRLGPETGGALLRNGLPASGKGIVPETSLPLPLMESGEEMPHCSHLD